MEFDPDAFLSGGTAVAEPPKADAFDPDVFLAQPAEFDPDAFIATPAPAAQAAPVSPAPVVAAAGDGGADAGQAARTNDAVGAIRTIEDTLAKHGQIMGGNPFEQALRGEWARRELASRETAEKEQKVRDTKESQDILSKEKMGRTVESGPLGDLPQMAYPGELAPTVPTSLDSDDSKVLQREIAAFGEPLSPAERVLAPIGAGMANAPQAGANMLQYVDYLFYKPIDAMLGTNLAEPFARELARRSGEMSKRSELATTAGGENYGTIASALGEQLPMLPVQLATAGGASALSATAQAGVKSALAASSAFGGLQSGSSAFAGGVAERLKKGQTLKQATDAEFLPSISSGLITAAATQAFGATGIESAFVKAAPATAAKRIFGMLKQGGFEVAEEVSDESGQIVNDLVNRKEVTPEEAVKRVGTAAVVASILGTGVAGLHAAMEGSPVVAADPEAPATPADITWRGAEPPPLPPEVAAATTALKTAAASARETSPLAAAEAEKLAAEIEFQARKDAAAKVTQPTAVVETPATERQVQAPIAETEKAPAEATPAPKEVQPVGVSQEQPSTAEAKFNALDAELADDASPTTPEAARPTATEPATPEPPKPAEEAPLPTGPTESISSGEVTPQKLGQQSSSQPSTEPRPEQQSSNPVARAEQPPQSSFQVEGEQAGQRSESAKSNPASSASSSGNTTPKEPAIASNEPLDKFNKALQDDRRAYRKEVESRPIEQQPPRLWYELEAAKKGIGPQELTGDEVRAYKQMWQNAVDVAVAQNKPVFVGGKYFENPPKKGWTQQGEVWVPPAGKGPIVRVRPDPMAAPKPTEAPAQTQPEPIAQKTPATPASAAVAPAKVKIRDFNRHGKLTAEVEMAPEEAARKLRARESMFSKLLDCLNR